MNKSNTVALTEEELGKVAEYIANSGRLLKQATETSKKLLDDNEELATELAQMKRDKHDAERSAKVNKIAEVLNQQGLISKNSMPQKVAELMKIADEALDQLEKTIIDLSGTPIEKKAAEATFSTFDFLDQSLVQSVFSDGKPRPLSF